MNRNDVRWFDLFEKRGTRRDFLRVGGSAVALIAVGGALPARRADVSPRFQSDPFTLGVASGDPDPNGVVLWTRLGGQSLGEVGEPGADVPVRWEVSRTESFDRVVASGTALALPELGYSVHVEVDGLEPAHVYHYRFLAGGTASPAGRARTAPALGAETESLRFAVCSCQNYEDGYYTAYRHMADEDLDLVLHLGDYIYEGGISRNAVRPNESAEVHTLEEYRARYLQYRRDADLQAAHAAFTWVVTWDDHDVENNYAGAVPQDSEDAEIFLLRRAAAYQAYYEFMPLRRRSVPRGPDMGLYRRVDFGDLVSMNVLDTRQYRDDQACGDRFQPDCDDLLNPSRTLLGIDQERWLLDGMRTSHARWTVLAQQVMMAPMANRSREGDRITHSMDAWDGYPGARQRLLDAFASGEVPSPVVFTGDVHSSWVNDLHVDGLESAVVGTELVGTSITTNGDGSDLDPRDDSWMDRNPHVRYHDERRGYVHCALTPERLTAQFRGVPYISRPGAPIQTRATFVVESGRPGAVRDG